MAIYLDYAATTPVDEAVAKKMYNHLTKDGFFGNPASQSHSFGIQALNAVEQAREHVSNLINAQYKEIVWTSGATESNNLAIKGSAFNSKTKNHIITSKLEHKAVLDVCAYLQRHHGFDITYLNPNINGEITVNCVAEAVKPETLLVSLMHVNNETGIINPITEIGQFTRKNGIIFHVDAAQAVGKTPIDVNRDNIDLLSMTSHKIYGPKGIGALYVRRKPRVRLVSQIHGGGHERGFRSGTLATHQIVGMGEAYRLAQERFEVDSLHVENLHNQLCQGLQNIPNMQINAKSANRIANIINVGFADINAQDFMEKAQGLAISAGSACMSASNEPSYVLKALGIDDSHIFGSLRYSFGRFTTRKDIDEATRLTQSIIKDIR